MEPSGKARFPNGFLELVKAKIKGCKALPQVLVQLQRFRGQVVRFLSYSVGQDSSKDLSR